MAKYIFTDGSVVVAGTDLSDHAFSMDTPQTREQIDVSGFSPTGAKEFLPGSREDVVTIQFLQDFAASKVHATLQPLFQAGSSFLLTLKPTSGAVSATNPKLEGSVSLFTYNGLSGNLNERGEMTAEFRATGSTGLVWGTA